MSELPVITVADLEAQLSLDLDAFDNDEAVRLGLHALAIIRERELNLAVKVVLREDVVFLAKLGTTGPENDYWLDAKAATVMRFGEPSLLVRRRHEEAGTPFEDRDDVDHHRFKAHGGSMPIRVAGEIIGTVTTSGEPDIIDHATTYEAVLRYLADLA